MRKCCAIVLGVIFLCLNTYSKIWGQTEPAETRPVASSDMQGIVYTADEINYDQKTSRVLGRGHVRITYGDMVLTAEEVDIDVQEKKAYARGNVHVAQGDKVFEGTQIIYDFTTKEAQVDSVHIMAEPWYASGDRIERHSAGDIEIHGGQMSTCNLDDPHWRLSAKELHIFPGDKIVAYKVVVYIGDVPVFYWPHYAYSLKDRRGKFIFVPGNNSDWGTYLLTGYRYEVGDHQRGTVHVDYREDRGVAYGVDHEYATADKASQGLFRVYYLDERNRSVQPLKEDQRHRVKWSHKQNFTDQLWSVVEWNDLSDDSIIKDYVQKEYENNPEPESYVYTQYSMPRSNVSLLAKEKTNPFFDTVEYEPQVQWHTSSVHMGDLPGEWPVYLNTNVAATNVHKDFDDVVNSTNRFDILEEVSSSKKVGFVGVRPYVGVRETYYSHDLEDESGTRGAFRSGVALNTKMYKTMDYTNEKWDINGLRIVHEPTIDFRFQDTPTMKPEELEPFDAVDAVDYENFIQLRLENRLQTRRFSTAGNGQQQATNHNLIQHRLYANYHPRGSEWGNAKRLLSEIYQDFEVHPWNWLTLDVNTIIDPYERRYNEVQTDLIYQREELPYSFSLGHHYRRDQNDEVSAGVRWKMGEKWHFSVVNNYDMRSNYMSRQEYAVIRDLHCWRSILSYAHKRDDLQSEDEVWLAFQLKAFNDDVYDFTEGLHGSLS